MRRLFMLYLVRLCIPLFLVLMLALFSFSLGDAYEQLNFAFNALLVITLIGIEVRCFVRAHWLQCHRMVPLVELLL